MLSEQELYRIEMFKDKAVEFARMGDKNAMESYIRSILNIIPNYDVESIRRLCRSPASFKRRKIEDLYHKAIEAAQSGNIILMRDYMNQILDIDESYDVSGIEAHYHPSISSMIDDAKKAARNGDRKLMNLYIKNIKKANPDFKPEPIKRLLTRQAEMAFIRVNVDFNLERAMMAAQNGNKKMMNTYLKEITKLDKSFPKAHLDEIKRNLNTTRVRKARY